ncbi:carboxypeptidase A2 [Flagelloscypha sp. PMI_526]|nr:carboxypeptidase A2 [Flagelloscypha sp. PMI_526]
MPSSWNSVYRHWTDSPKENSSVDVLVPEKQVADVESKVDAIRKEFGIQQDVIVMHQDLGESIKVETNGMYTRTRAAPPTDESWFKQYHTWDDHMAWLNAMASKFSNNSRVVVAGQSLEGRNISALHVYGSAGPDVKPAVVYHSTVHAREWITTKVNEYIAFQLLSGASNGTKDLLDKFELYMFPFSNPDGFVHTTTVERLHRKNMRPAPAGSTNAEDCSGIDVNRNWDHSSWNQSEGASISNCAQDYKGPSANSEPETQVLSSWLMDKATKAPGVASYLDWHSYSQLAMSPYGYKCDSKPPDSAELESLVAGFSTALQAVHNTVFKSGPICQTIYQVSGDSVDYAYENAKIKYAFTVELRDTGENGFVLPPDEILPSSEEVWAGVKYMWQNMDPSFAAGGAKSSNSSAVLE